MQRPILSVPLILAGLTSFGATPLESQELGAFFSMVSSDQVELPNPTGFGAFAQLEVPGPWLARLSLHRFSDGTRKMGTVCRNYSARIDCHPEMTDTSVTMSGLRGAFMRAFHLGGLARVGAGVGVSFNQVSAEATGEAGGPADLLAPNTGQLGVLVLFSAAVNPVPGVPVRITGTLTGHWVKFRSCSSNDPPEYAPFCGTNAFKDVEMGLSYTFPR